MKPIIVIPTYNEIENIELLIKAIYEELNGVDFSILIVDDNSKDGTANVVKKIMQKKNNLYLLERAGKFGLASAYIDGFKYGIGIGADAFIQMDADFSHDPCYLKEIISQLKDNELVVASRNIDGGGVLDWGFLRNLISKGGSLYSRIILNCPIKDLTGGYNGWKIDILNKIGLDNIISKGFAFQIEMKYRAYVNNATVKEFPIIFKDRKNGKSKMSKKIFFEALLNVLKIRFMVKK